MRIAVDISKGQGPVDSLDCFGCEKPVTPVETRPNSVVWYCQACDVFHETTATGVRLRSFRKENNNIIVLQGAGDGAIG